MKWSNGLIYIRTDSVIAVYNIRLAGWLAANNPDPTSTRASTLERRAGAVHSSVFAIKHAVIRRLNFKFIHVGGTTISLEVALEYCNIKSPLAVEYSSQLSFVYGTMVLHWLYIWAITAAVCSLFTHMY